MHREPDSLDPSDGGHQRIAGTGRLEQLATTTSRRGFLARVSAGLLAVAGAGTILAADDAEAYTNFCGHTWTTGNCPHPTGLPRIDSRGLPLRAKDGKPVDDLGRLIDRKGRPINERGVLLRDPDGALLATAPRSAVCQAVGARYRIKTQIDGSWYRCCGGQVRRLMDCCSYSPTRINGDESLTGYCYKGRTVFCVTYLETKVPC